MSSLEYGGTNPPVSKEILRDVTQHPQKKLVLFYAPVYNQKLILYLAHVRYPKDLSE